MCTCFTVMLTGYGELAVISGAPGLSISFRTILWLNINLHSKNSKHDVLHAGCSTGCLKMSYRK